MGSRGQQVARLVVIGGGAAGMSAASAARRLAPALDAIGRTIELDLKKYTIVGVLPAGFQGLRGPGDVWIPLHTLNDRILNEAQSHSWELVARRKPGVSVAQAESVVTQLGDAVDRDRSGQVQHPVRSHAADPCDLL